VKRGVNVAVGAIVKICDEGVRRGDWPIGRVTKVFPGEDGLVRMADVRTSTGCLKRVINKLIVLNGFGAETDGAY
jgi:Family of unknown function (DUF5641)